MAERNKGQAPSSAAGGEAPAQARAGATAAPPSAPGWRLAWQVPALFASLVLFLGAVAAYILSAPRPDYDGMIAQAERLVERERYSDALEHLNKTVLKFVNSGGAPHETVERFHVLRARALYMVQRVRSLNVEQNHQQIAAEYAKAENAGASLDSADLYRLADTYISLGRLDKAEERVRRLPAEAHAQRAELLKRMVRVKFESPAPDPNSTLALVDLFLKDPALTASDRAWALARQAELLIRQGYMDQAIGRLLATIPRTHEADPAQQGELHLLLARAYLETGASDEARRELERAASLLPEIDAQRGRAMNLLARLDARRGDREEARQRYTAVLEQYTEDAVRLPALMGLAEADAAAGDVAASVEHFTQLVDDLALGRRCPEVTKEGVSASLMDRSTDRSSAEDHAGALRFADLAARLHPPNATPPRVLLAQARAHRALAEARLAGIDPQGARLVELARLDPPTREQARADFVAAGECFRRHAEAVVETDNTAYGNSLWLAADSFDRAGAQGEAVTLFTEFVDGMPGDPRRDEARFRLAQAYQARGDYEAAETRYRELIDEAAEGRGGPFADASYVPLARVLLSNMEESDDEQAKQLLSAVVEGRVGGADTTAYRDALVLLAGMHYRAGEYAQAIMRLEEAVARYPDDAHAPALLFDLADSHRRDAAAIARTLEGAMPESERLALQRTRTMRLERAMALFAQVRDTLASRDPERLSEPDRLRLRNSCFYLGDAAFELRDFAGAIRLYDAARERYPRDPASLVAMIQIVNAYVEQGDLKRAATANERARRFYESLPDEVWADPSLPIGRREWQRWLDSLAILGGATAGAGDEPPTGR